MAIEVIVNIRAVSTGTQIFGMDREAGESDGVRF
jgi:hypothetical protein